MFSTPLLSVPSTLAPVPTLNGSCKVFYPGKYTAASKPVLSGENYFRSGEYYFEDVTFDIDHALVIAGYSDGQYGDTQSFTSTLCTAAQDQDRTDGGARRHDLSGRNRTDRREQPG